MKQLPRLFGAALLSLACGCTFVHTEQCGPVQICHYRYPNLLLAGAEFGRTEFSISLKSGSRQSFTLDACAPSKAVVKVRPLPFPGALPNMLLVHVPNLDPILEAKQREQLSPKEERIIGAIEQWPLDGVALEFRAYVEDKTISESTIDLSSRNWYLIAVEGHRDGILVRPIFPRDLAYDRLDVHVLGQKDASSFRAIALANSEIQSEFSRIRRLDDGAHPVLRTMSEVEFRRIDNRSRRWPPVWMKLDPLPPKEIKQGRTP